MIDREELRRLMELEGHDPETIDKVLAWYYGMLASVDQLAAPLNMLQEEIAEATQSMAELWEELTRASQSLQKEEKPRRPPRCIDPKNKAVTRVQRPARVARSSCRKIHK